MTARDRVLLLSSDMSIAVRRPLVRQELGERPRHTPVGPRKMKLPAAGSGPEPGARAPYRVRHRLRPRPARPRAGAGGLPSDQLLHLAFHQMAHRNAGPLADDLRDVFLVDLLLEHAGSWRVVPRLRCRRFCCSSAGTRPYLQLRRLRVVAPRAARRARAAPPRALPSACARAGSASFSCSHWRFSRWRLLFQLLETLARACVGLLPQRLALDLLQLHRAAARPRRAPPASSRSPYAASTPPRRSGRSPCRAGSGRRCSGSRGRGPDRAPSP